MTEAQHKPVCRLCGNFPQSVRALPALGGGTYRMVARVSCRTCGTYDITHLLDATIERFPKSFSSEDRYRLSAITRRASDKGEILELGSGTPGELLESAPQPSPVEQVDLVLDHLAAHTPAGGKPAPLDPSKDYPIAHAHGPEGLQFIVKSMLTDGLIERTDTSTLPHYRITTTGYRHIEERRKAKRASPATGWPKVDRGLEETRRRFEEAATAEQFQAVGLLCRETVISLAQAVYDPERQGTLDGVEASGTDAKRMLEAFIAAELGGQTNEEARAHAKSALKLAVALQHDRTADSRTAALCLEATESLVKLVAIIAGKRDR